ncbi:MAG: NAD-dependent protein deacylase [Clostridiales Family XIII bacterium]|jgi:NAD-dependent deacetylase|nr:NAD-dependent protein deacylase [Clostridiales Family XIII bacterium]
MNDNALTLKGIVEESSNIVFFGGAGVSTESGIPDFRSETGLYKARAEYGRSPESLVSHSLFIAEPSLFFDYYKKNLIFRNAKPNAAHFALSKLEKEGKILAIVTQNIDGLHQAAGSVRVRELHGSVQRNYCMKCGATFDLDYILDEAHCKDENGVVGSVPFCDKCGGTVRPDVVLYEEPLEQDTVSRAVDAIARADTLIVGGTSLVVYPAAEYLRYFRGRRMVVINKTETSADGRADLVIREPIGETMSAFL